jgi:methyl-accepting chemotaxis protein
MAGIKELKEELSEMRKSMEKLTEELHDTNLAIRESLELTSQTIKEASVNFSKALEETMKKMSDLTIQMNVRDTVLKSLGIDGMIPDFFKKKK